MKVLFSIISFTILLLTIFITWYAFKNGNEQRRLYPLIENKNDINGILIQKEIPIISFNKGAILMKTTDDKKFTFPLARNYLYKKNSIKEFVQLGDSIVKRKGVDSIYIYRNGEKYYFVLMQILEREIR